MTDISIGDYEFHFSKNEEFTTGEENTFRIFTIINNIKYEAMSVSFDGYGNKGIPNIFKMIDFSIDSCEIKESDQFINLIIPKPFIEEYFDIMNIL